MALRLGVFFLDYKKRFENALRSVASVTADIEFNRYMANFYTEQVVTTDPHTDWHAFAEYKDNQLKYQKQTLHLEQRVLPKYLSLLEARKLAAKKVGAL